MTIRHMRIFVAVVHENSITGAAGKLYLSQPAVSLAVRELEEYYGVRLFERMSRRIFVTEAGRKLYDYATHIVSLFEEMEAAIVKEGKEAGQGVAYLDDGTMIVVEGGKRCLGETVPVIVTSVLQTAAGRMIFARLR